MRYIFISFLNFFCFSAFAQSPFEFAYSGNNLDGGMMIHQLPNGNFVMATQYDLNPNGKIALLELDSLGDTLWTRSYQEPQEMALWSMIVTSDQGFLLTGFYYPNSSTPSRGFVIKTDSVGNMQWTNYYKSFHFQLYEAVETSNNCYTLFGNGYDSLGNDGVVMIHIDPTGNILWKYYYSISIGGTLGSGFTRTHDGGYALCGRYMYTSQNGGYVIRTDSLGNLIWSYKYYTPQSLYDQANTIIETSDNGFLLTFNGQLKLLKIDSTGSILWSHSFREDNSNFVINTNDGGFLQTSWTSGILISNYYMLGTICIKGNADGSIAWTKAFGQFNTSWFNVGYPQQTFDNGYILTGAKFGMEVIIKTDSLGDGVCDEYSYSVQDTTYTVVQAPDTVVMGNINVYSYQNLIFQNSFYWNRVNACTVGIENSDYKPNIIQIYPNPSSGKLNFTNLSPGNEIHIFNVTGQLIFQKYYTGEKVEIDLSGNSNGIYFYRITDNKNNTSQGKFIIE